MTTLKNILISLALIAVGTASAQTVSVNPTSINLSALVGGASVSQPLSITATGGNTAVAVFPSQSWLTVSPSGGATPLQVTVTANPTGLTAGTYTDTNFRVVTSSQTINIPVTFTVGTVSVSPQSLNFSYTVGSTGAPQGQLLTVSGQNLNFTVAFNTNSGGNWLQASPVGNQVNVVLNGLVLSTLTAGTYSGTVTVTQNGSAPIIVPVTLTVNPEPPVTVSPTAINLNYQIGGQNNVGAQEPVTLATTSTAAIPYQFLTPTVGNNPTGSQWITVAPSSGSIPAGGNAQPVISYNTASNLPAGSYSGSVPLTATGGVLSQSTIAVNLLVASNPLLVVPTQSLNFLYELNSGTLPPAQSVTAQSTAVAPASATGQMAITVAATTASGGAWLTVTPTTNLNTGTPFSVSANPAGLAPGTYTGSVVVTPAAGTAAGNGAQTIAVTLTVGNDPAIAFDTTPIVFPYQVGQTAPAAQTINLSSSTGTALNYTVTSAETTCGSVNWLALGGATTGSTAGSFTVAPANLAGLAAGTCTGTITVAATNPATGNAAINSPISVPVTLYVSNSALLTVNPSSLGFSTGVSGAGSTKQIQVNSTDGSTVTYSVSFSTTTGGNSWLTVGPLSGSTASNSNVINVSVVPGLLSPGVYTGAITITATGVADSPYVIPVVMQVTAGSISLTSNALNFTYTQNGAMPVAQTVQVTGQGNTALNFSVAANSGSTGGNWLSVTPTTGTTPASLTISANPANLAVGTYNGSVVVTSPNAANSPAAIAVTLTVTSGTVTATPAPTADGLVFTLGAGGTAPATQAIALASTPAGAAFSATATMTTGTGWLSVTPSSGTAPGTVTISANAGTLAVGTYTGTVTITAPGAAGSPFTYKVTLNVVTPITIVAAPAALSFGYTLQSAAPAAQTVQITAAGPPGIGTIATFPFAASATTATGGPWLAVTPATGTVPGSISVSINPQGLTAGSYTGSVTVATGSANGATSAVIPVTLTVTTAPTPVIAAITNAASGFVGAISPGEEVSIYGTNFGPASVASATITNKAYPTTLANTQVLFDGVPAPIIAVVSGQVNVMVPYGIAGRATTTVQVSYLGVNSSGIAYNVTSAVPGIYTVNQAGTGQGAILNQDLSVNSSTNPAAAGSIIAIYMTGEGVTSPASTTGQVAPSDGTGLNKPVQTVTATINGVTAPVQYYGSAPGLVYGVMQVNVTVPANTPSGNVPVVVNVGSSGTQTGVTLAVKGNS